MSMHNLDRETRWDEESGGAGLEDRLYRWYHRRGSNYDTSRQDYHRGEAD